MGNAISDDNPLPTLPAPPAPADNGDNGEIQRVPAQSIAPPGTINVDVNKLMNAKVGDLVQMAQQASAQTTPARKGKGKGKRQRCPNHKTCKNFEDSHRWGSDSFLHPVCWHYQNGKCRDTDETCDFRHNHKVCNDPGFVADGECKRKFCNRRHVRTNTPAQS
jgi:hypothetical protein